ncbi:MAG: DoxX family membrane protein [Betaproteobacteria bacterium]
MNRSTLLYGIGAMALGLVGIAFGDFALQWQPVPKDFPSRLPLAYAAGALTLLAGGLTIARKTAQNGVILLTAIYTLWTIVLHGPYVAAHALQSGAWQAFCEIAAMAAAGFAVYFAMKGDARLVLAGRVAFGLCALVFGLNHFVYADFTASMVPAWLPFPLAWAYGTGAGHAAAGLALVTGIRAKPAAQMLAMMMGSFVVLLHIPRVLGDPGSHIEWAMLAIATTLTGSAWGLACAIEASGTGCPLA